MFPHQLFPDNPNNAEVMMSSGGRRLLFLGIPLALALAGCDELITQPAEPKLAQFGLGQGQDRVRVIVELRARGAQASVAQQAVAQGASVVYQYRRFPLLALEVNANALQGLLRSPQVVSIMEDVESPPSLDNSLPVINADDVRALGWNGAGFVVGILDTGIDNAHPFVAGRVVEEACFSTAGTDRLSLCPDGNNSQTGAGSASIAVANCQDGGTNICDHGMHVAGIAAGDGTGVGGAPAAGVAPGAGIIAIQVFRRATDDASCGGDPGDAPCVLSSASDQIAALEHVLDLAASHAVVSVNMSLGGGMNTSACDDDSRKTAIDALLAANIATVISSGNDGFDDAVGAPGCISTAVTVGATNNADGVTRNRGPLLDLFAPGQGITSSVANNLFGGKSGTSMAAPHVTGAWAIMNQVAPSLTANQILTILSNTGVTISYTSAGSTVSTPRIDLLAAIQATTQPPQLTATHATVTVNEGSPAANTGTFADPDGDPVSLSASIGTVLVSGAGTWSWSFATNDGPAQSQTVTITGTDDKDVSGSVSFALSVLNVAPTVNAGPDATLTSGETFNFSGTFSDPGVVDFPWGWVIDWGDGATSIGSTNTQAAAINGSHQFCAAGNYTITLGVTDKDGGMGSDQRTLTVEYLGVGINIEPTENPNPVNLSNRGLIPVAVLGSATFNVSAIDVSTLVLGDGTGTDVPVAQRNNGTYYASMEDVNGDGIMDLVLQFRVPALVAAGELHAGTTQLSLRGFLSDGCTNFLGTDSVVIRG